MIKVRLRTDTKEPGWQVDIKAMPLGAFRAKRYRYTAPRSITTKSAGMERVLTGAMLGCVAVSERRR